MSIKENVVILGASDKEDRYSYKAMKLLEQFGHNPLLVHPRLSDIEGRSCFPDILSASKSVDKVDTLTLYVNPEISLKSADMIVNLAPGRVIFNPGTENPELAKILDNSGIRHEEACTLVLLNTNQY